MTPRETRHRQMLEDMGVYAKHEDPPEGTSLREELVRIIEEPFRHVPPPNISPSTPWSRFRRRLRLMRRYGLKGLWLP